MRSLRRSTFPLRMITFQKGSHWVLRSLRVKEELADVLVYCQNMLDCLKLDADESIMNKMDKNEAKYPVEKARGSSAKYDQL